MRSDYYRIYEVLFLAVNHDHGFKVNEVRCVEIEGKKRCEKWGQPSDCMTLSKSNEALLAVGIWELV